ncbi:MAG TPA: molybdenum cofactor guanylyltransferase [Acidimicrobiales bacterium]|nr:molybdenum cofactor guanylyltransferase [Acidimicrobiales bacterium]
MRATPTVAALLLTGGASSRLGRPKAALEVAGTTLARRLAGVLSEVCPLVLEVGPGYSDLARVAEEPPGEGPLGALAAGWGELRARGHDGPALAVACDLPHLSVALVRLLAEWPAPGSVVPVVAGRAQPLLARWSPSALGATPQMVASGERSLRGLLALSEVTTIDEADWSAVATAREFADVDTPADAARLGLAL